MAPKLANGRTTVAIALALAGLALSACARSPAVSPPALQPQPTAAGDYLIGPGDTLQVFVWRNPELSVAVPVRPDGRISTPLVADMTANGKTPATLAADIEEALREYVQTPVVTVIVTDFVGPYSQQVRVVGEAAEPRALPYRDDMSLLDVMITVGGVTPFAAGNRAVITRQAEGGQERIPVRLDRLLEDGDLAANVAMRPGDVLVIPQSWF